MQNLVRGLVAGVVAIGAAGTALAQAPSQFDMICTGTQIDKNELTEKSKPWEIRYSIDLEAAQYCPARQGQRCKAPLPIHAVEPHRIVLNDDWKMIGRDNVGSTMEISRSDGSLSGRAIMPGIYFDEYKAKCSLADFTPLPKTMF